MNKIKKNKIRTFQQIIQKHETMVVTNAKDIINRIFNPLVSAKKYKRKPLRVFKIFIAVGFSAVLTSCSSSAQSLENAQENSTQTKTDLNEAQKKYEADVRILKNETEKEIAVNNLILADIKGEMNNNFEKDLKPCTDHFVTLKQKNRNLSIRMKEYKTNAIENWETFKVEFNDDMSELGLALNTFFN